MVSTIEAKTITLSAWYGFRPTTFGLSPAGTIPLYPWGERRYLLSHVFTPFDAFDQEEVWLLLLNNKNKITHQSMIYRGTVNAATIRVAELYKPAVRLNAPNIIMSHVHPSGAVDPSPDDVAVTQMAYQAGKLLQVSLLDHIIVGREQWLSLKTQGMGFND
jgi:DNA repair protein RadC